MRVAIDAAGRLVIPKPLRERIGLTPGTVLELNEVGDRLELRPAGRQVRIEVVDGRPVARAPEDAPVLTADEVRGLIERDRQ